MSYVLHMRRRIHVRGWSRHELPHYPARDPGTYACAHVCMCVYVLRVHPLVADMRVHLDICVRLRTRAGMRENSQSKIAKIVASLSIALVFCSLLAPPSSS